MRSPPDLDKTRSLATAACTGGHVRVNSRSAKPATPVRVGDRVGAVVNGVRKDLEVVRVIDQRVGAPIAAECYLDHTPPPAAAPGDPDHVAGRVFGRDPGAGRPTKRDRRQLDRFRTR
jgi:ribosome-associated heat shock protein Hsp15